LTYYCTSIIIVLKLEKNNNIEGKPTTQRAGHHLIMGEKIDHSE